MPKSRFTDEERIRIVEAYINNEIGWNQIIYTYGIANSTLEGWIRKYKQFGSSGLAGSNRYGFYSAEIKKAAVEAYLNGVGSQEEICRMYKIKDRKSLREWIQVYNSHKELSPRRKRRSDTFMTKGRATTYEERIEIVSYYIEHDRNYAAVIEKYGVSYSQIYSWVKKYKENGPAGLVDKRGKRKLESEMTELEKLRAENRILEAKNKRLETENAVLKKLEAIERGWR